MFETADRLKFDRLKFLMPESLIIIFLYKCLIILISHLYLKLLHLHEKNNFAKESKNLARYRFENNFVWIIKIIM